MVVEYKVNQHGLKTLLRKLDARRVTRARDQALNKGSAHVVRVIREQSRVKSGTYKDGWITRKHGDSHSVVNVGVPYSEFVTGRTMATTLSGGRRRGAGVAFMRRIRREVAMPVRRLMQGVIRDILTR